MPLVCGVDSSTQSCKVEVRDADTGELVAEGRASHPPVTPPRSEQDPTQWQEAFDQAFKKTGIGEVAAVSVAGQQHGLVVLDADREVVRPAKLWNDTESAPDAAALVDALGAEGWAKACGSVPVPSFTITKLAWLRRVEPESFARISHVLLPHDWLTYRLCGELHTDRGDASGTGYWSPSEQRWRPDLLALIDPRIDWAAMLPGLLGISEPAGSWGKAVVGPGTGDNMAAALGLGIETGEVAVSIGTSGTVYAVSEAPTADATGAVAGFADATGRYLPLVCTLNATKVTDAIARLLGVDHETFDDMGLDATPGAGGVVCVPYFDGERTPNRPDATGRLAGIRSDVTQQQLARAALEGVVCGLLEGLDALAAAGVDCRGRIRLTGGGARSRAYRKVLADLSGREVVTSSVEEHVSLGACVQAVAALEGIDPAAIRRAWAVGTDHTTEPDTRVAAEEIRDSYARQAAERAGQA